MDNIGAFLQSKLNKFKDQVFGAFQPQQTISPLPQVPQPQPQNLFQQAQGFLQKYPTPASYIGQNIVQPVIKQMQMNNQNSLTPVQKQFGNPLQNPYIQRIGQDLGQGAISALKLTPPGLLVTKIQDYQNHVTPAQSAQNALGDVYNTAKGAGYIFSPVSGLVLGGALGAGTNAIGNVLSGKPWNQNLDQSAVEGMSQGSAFGVVSKFNPLSKPVSQLSTPLKRIIGRAGSEGLEGTVQGLIQPLANGQKRKDAVLEQTVFGVGMGALGGSVEEITKRLAKVPQDAKEAFVKKVMAVDPTMTRKQVEEKLPEFIRLETNRLIRQEVDGELPQWQKAFRKATNGSWDKPVLPDLGFQAQPLGSTADAEKINKYLSNAYKVYSGQKPYQVIARIADDVANKAEFSGNKDIIIRKAIFDHFSNHFIDPTTGTVDKQRLFNVIKSINIPDEIYQSKEGRLNFFKNLENNIERQVIIAKDSMLPGYSSVITQFDNNLENTKDLKYSIRQKNKAKKIFPSESGGPPTNPSSNILSEVPGIGSRNFPGAQITDASIPQIGKTGEVAPVGATQIESPNRISTEQTKLSKEEALSTNPRPLDAPADPLSHYGKLTQTPPMSQGISKDKTISSQPTQGDLGPLPWEDTTTTTQSQIQPKLKAKQKPEQLSLSDAQKKADIAQLKAEGDKEGWTGIVKKYFGKVEAAKTEGTQYATQLKVPEGTDGKAIISALESGKNTGNPQVDGFMAKYRQLDDAIFKKAKEAGIDINYLRDHVTHFWDNSDKEIEQAYAVFRQKYGPSAHRMIPTYEEGIALGLKPKYTDPTQILGISYQKLRQVQAGLETFETMKKSGLIIPAAAARGRSGFAPIDAPGFPQSMAKVDKNMAIAGNWYAPKNIAEKINVAFSPQPNDTMSKFFSATAKLSGKAQDISMSSGIPGTPINAFTFANMTKEIMAGRPVQAVKSILRSVSDKATRQYFSNMAPVIKRMQLNDVPVNTNFNIESIAPEGNVKLLKDTVSGVIHRDLGQAKGAIDKLWGRAMNDPTFERFMPMLQVQMFDDIEKAALKSGKSADEASQVASQAVKNFYGTKGIYDNATRNKTADNIISTLVFAPKFRESMVKFWINNAKALRNPMALENRSNAMFVGSAIATYIAYDTINKSLTGKHLNENPPGTEDKLLIPVGNGQVIGVPYLSSIATIPRGIFRIAGRLAKGDTEGAGKDIFQTFGSTPIKTAGEIMSNEDYFGKPIYKESDSPVDRFKKIGQYAVGSVQQPYIKELTDPRSQNDPLYQRASRLTELPLRFYTEEGLKNKLFYGARDATLSKNEAGFFPQSSQEVRDAFASGQINEKQMKDQLATIAKDEQARAKAKESGYADGESKTFYKDKNGKVQSIDKVAPAQPTLTGSKLVDREKMDKYATDLSGRIGDLITLSQVGKMSQQDALQQVQQLEAQRASIRTALSGKVSQPRSIQQIMLERERSGVNSDINGVLKQVSDGKLSASAAETQLASLKQKLETLKSPRKLRAKKISFKKMKVKKMPKLKAPKIKKLKIRKI